MANYYVVAADPGIPMYSILKISNHGLSGSGISLDEPLNIDYDGNELLLSDIIGTDSDIVKNELEQSDQKAMFYEAFKDLSKREKEILMFRYGLMNYDELTQKDVAKMMGISQSYISRLEKKIIKKLRNKLNYNEIK